MIILLCFVLPFLILLGIIIGPVFYFTNKLQKKINEKNAKEKEEKRILEEKIQKEREEQIERIRVLREHKERIEKETREKQIKLKEQKLNRDFEGAKEVLKKLPQDIQDEINKKFESSLNDKKQFIDNVQEQSYEHYARLKRESTLKISSINVTKKEKEDDMILDILERNGINKNILDLSKIHRSHDS